MKFGCNWLKFFLNIDCSFDELVEHLNLLGLEVDSITSNEISLEKVVLAKVQKVSKHPNADKLNLCLVNSGKEVLQIVCGADNVVADMYVPLAINGAILSGGLKIRNSKIRGEPSQGMICSKEELGLEKRSEGIFDLNHAVAIEQAKGTKIILGDSISQLSIFNNISDTIIELDLTPNRADCFSVLGIARDLKSKFSYLNPEGNVILKKPELFAIQLTKQIKNTEINEDFTIHIRAANKCLSFSSLMIKGVDNHVTSPEWLQYKLNVAGVQCINLMVDLANYVMLELGQPMHVYDFEKLKTADNNSLIIREARPSESLYLLNDEKISLQNELVISDVKNVIGLAGVMGGKSTAVEKDSKFFLLESAFFTPNAIHGVARKHGLFTESSMRFERGVDPRLNTIAIQRYCYLLKKIVNSNKLQFRDAIQIVSNDYEAYIESIEKSIRLPIEDVSSKLGDEFDLSTLKNIFGALDFKVDFHGQGDNSILQVTPPSYRFDINIKEDLIEEVARIHGYNNFSSAKLQPYEISLRNKKAINIANYDQTLNLKNLLKDLGFNETITYSFVGQDEQFFASHDSSVELQNPISIDMSIMRNSILPSLLKTAAFNLKRQAVGVKIFEVSNVISFDEQGSTETQKLSILMCGNLEQPSWTKSDIDNAKPNFYKLKGVFETLCTMFGIDNGLNSNYKLEFSAINNLSGFHPGQAAKIYIVNKNKINNIGYIGKIHPLILKKFDLSEDVYALEVELLPLFNALEKTKVMRSRYAEISRFPSVSRDISLRVPADVCYQDIVKIINKTKINILDNYVLFDYYAKSESRNIDDTVNNSYSLAIRLKFSSYERTLVDQDVNFAISQILHKLEDQLLINLNK